MDAKPQRPRTLRLFDENVAVHNLNGPATGKTLHQRTKSTPAFSTLLNGGAIKAAAAAAAATGAAAFPGTTANAAGTAGTANKKVLGEATTNAKVARPWKDDSEVGKPSLGKNPIEDPIQAAKNAVLARGPTRPLPAKPTAQTLDAALAKTLSAFQPAPSAEPEPGRRITAKKSTKVFKDAQVALQPEAETKKPVIVPEMKKPVVALESKKLLIAVENKKPATVAEIKKPATVAEIKKPATVAETKRPLTAGEMYQMRAPTVYLLPAESSNPVDGQPAPSAAATTERVPICDAPAARPTNIYLPPGFTSEQEYMTYLDYHSKQLLHGSHGVNAPVVQGQIPFMPQEPHQQYFDAEEEHFDLDEGYTTARSFGLPVDNTTAIIIVPGPTVAEQRELQEAKAYVEATRAPEDVEDELWDTSMVAEYSEEIFQYMQQLERRMSPNPRYMEAQQEIQWSMRAVLVDWLVQVHQRFNLLPETLFLTINCMDRFLSSKIVSLGKLQLVGATAIFIAAKYEEVQCPTIEEIVFMVDGGYTADELLKAERFMLSMLQFELGWPGPMSFLRRISKADDYDLETRTLAKYFLEVTIMDERFVGCTPSYLAAGAHCVARLMLYGASWSKAHVHYSGYTYSQMRPLLEAMVECCESPTKHHKAVYEKYTDKRYKRASIFVNGKMCEGFRLPHDPTSYFNGAHGFLQ